MLDLKMPKVDGLEVLKQVKSDPVLKTIPIVILTSSRVEQDIIESYNLGVNAYVVKPVAFEKFLEVVKRISLFWILTNEYPAKKP
jgi:CheY-like chemotaxis protein